MTEKEKNLLDILERTKRIRKDINNLENKIDRLFNNSIIWYLYSNAEGELYEAIEKLEEKKEEFDNDPK